MAFTKGRLLEALDLIGEKIFPGRSSQFAALFAKNVLVAWRSRRATAIRLFAPFIFLLLALVVNLSLNANNALQERFTAVPHSSGSVIGSIPPCGEDLYISGRSCIDFVYSPNTDSFVNSVVDSIMANNQPPIPSDKVLGFPSRSLADNYLLAHPDGAMGAVHFTRFNDSSVGYIIQSNSTVKYFKGIFQDPTQFFSMPMTNAVARELSRRLVVTAPASLVLTDPEAAFVEWAPRLVKFPHPSLQTTNLLGQVLSSFIFASLMFGFVTQMSNLVSEKDSGLRLALRNMGMLDSSYWWSWMTFDTLITFTTALLLVIFGMILQFNYFLKNDFGLLLMLFWLFGLAMTSFSYFLSTLVKKTQGAVYLGFSVFIVGWIFQTVIFIAQLPYSSDYYYSKTNRWGRVFFWVFNLFPWNPLTKGILDLNEATLTPSDPGLRWGDMYSYCSYAPDISQQTPYDPRLKFRSYNCVFPLWQGYLTLLVQWAAYWCLAVYLSNVLPNEVGIRRPWWFLFSRSYWLPRPTDTATALSKVLQEEACTSTTSTSTTTSSSCPYPPCGPGSVDDDVAAEEQRVRQQLLGRTTPDAAGHLAGKLSTAGNRGYAAELYGLRKVFRAKQLPCLPLRAAVAPCRGRKVQVPAKDFWAIRGTWLGIEEGQLFCLLGPNGAGKTTTINCMTGMLPYSGGDVVIYGQSISSEAGLDQVRPLMGVCPQFDVLWGELTGLEHLWIYGHIKGLPFTQVRGEARQLLERVKLHHATGMRSASYSGGMKRRLSVAIALLGNPKIVYLDEPTTGMDPISRRYVWDIIQAAKPGRAIVLTTHSMEEADILGDRIAIMARGQLRAIGNSIRLKQKYGSGYQLTVHLATPHHKGSSRAHEGSNQAQVVARMDAVKDCFRRGLQLEPIDEGRSLLHYLVPRNLEGRLVNFLSEFEGRGRELGVADLQCRLASLEEVFLTIARKAELEAAEQSGSSLVPVDLPEGGELLVPLGEEVVPHPSGDGRTYTIKWAQDDEGRLVVLDCQLAQGTVSSASTAATPAAMEAGSADLIASSCSNAACTNSKAQKQL